MPKEYKECVKTEKKKHSEKEAKKICAIAYYKRHGVSVNEAHKRYAKKSFGEQTMKIVERLARSKEALVREAKRIAKSTGGSPDDFVVIPITKTLRKHARMNEFAPDIADETYKYALIRKTVNGKDFVIIQVEGKLKLDFNSLPKNPMAEEMNQPIKKDADEDTVNVGPDDGADATKTKSLSANEEEKEKEEDCVEDECKEDKSDTKKSQLEVDRETEVPNEGAVKEESGNPSVGVVKKALNALEKAVTEGFEALSEDDTVALKSLLESVAKKEEDEAEDKNEKEVKKSVAEKDFLGKIMSKVSEGKDLTEIERKALSAAVAAAKRESGVGSSRTAKNILSKIMKKVASAETLSQDETDVLSAALDATKKAKSEVTKSIITKFTTLADETEDTPESIYAEITGGEPVEGLFAFTRKSLADKFIRRLRLHSVVQKSMLFSRPLSAEEVRKLPRKYHFIVEISD